MVTFPLDPEKLVLEAPGSVAPGSVVYTNGLWLLAAGHEAGERQQFVALGQIGQLSFPLVSAGIGECCVFVPSGEIELMVDGRPEQSMPVPEYAGSVVVTAGGAFLICTLGDHPFNVSVRMVSLVDGSILDPADIGIRKPIFVQYRLGISRGEQWHTVLDRSDAPPVERRG